MTLKKLNFLALSALLSFSLISINVLVYAENLDASVDESLCVHHPEHTSDCLNEDGICINATDGCPYCLMSWSWIDELMVLREVDGSWVLAVPRVSTTNPLTRDALLALLPAQINTIASNGDESIQSLTWDLSIIPEVGATSGVYTINAKLSDSNYDFKDDVITPSIIVQLGGAELETALPSGTPNLSEHIINGVSPSGTTINLFDYWITGQTDADNVDNKDINFLGGINSNHALLFGKNIRASFGTNYGEWNVWTRNNSPKTGIVKNTLDEFGYPALNLIINSNTCPNLPNVDGSESLAYLFDPNKASEGKESFSDVKGLLQVNSEGYYYYDSTKNYAVYYEDINSFVLYQYPGVLGTGAGSTGVPQFFPFNEAQTELTNGNLVNGIGSQHADINHYFGMHMSTRFIQQNGGYTDENIAVTYNFSGDDDVWIFIDGVLVADLGGVHDKASVEINFATGEIKINDAIQTQTLGDLLNTGSKTLKDNTYHTLDFFYLERGNTDSNMQLKYNLVTIPESSIIKVDQLGDAVSGAEFTLYAADDYETDGLKADPIALGTTNHNGEFVFLDENDFPLTLQNLYDKYKNSNDGNGNNLILVETKVPEGYRSSGEIGLYFDTTIKGEVLLLSNSIWDKGAYSMSKVTAITPNKISLLTNDGTNKNVILTGTNSVENPIMFAVVFKKVKDSEGNPSWVPVSGDPINGWYVAGNSSWDSVLKAAIANPYIFQLASSGAYQVEVKNLPGNIKKYYYVNGVADNSEYTVAYYYTEAKTLALATEENTWQIDESGDNKLERVFSMDLYVSNIKNRLLVQKVDDLNKPLNGVTFSLYKKDDITLKDDGTYTINVGANAFDTLQTSNINGILKLEGGGIFPTEGKVLPFGEYYLIESEGLAGYQKNETLIHVVVDNTGVYANAGTDNDGVSVLRGVGSIIKSMVQFAADDDVDTTLQSIKAALSTSVSYNNGSISWSGANWSSSDILHLKYANANKLLDYGLYETSQENVTIDDLTLTTEVGWSKLLIQQCYQHDDTVNTALKLDLGNQDITNLFSGTVTVRVENHRIGNLEVSKVVNGKYAPTTGPFTFTINLKDEGKNVSGTFKTLNQNNESGTITFLDGKATLSLKKNEKLKILGLLTDSSYTISETAITGFTTTITNSDNDYEIDGYSTSGTINHNTKEDEAISIEYNNSYYALIVNKLVSGNMGNRDTEFNFTITLTNGNSPVEGTFKTIVNQKDETGNIISTTDKTITFKEGKATFKLKHNQEIVILGLPAQISYNVEEVEADQDGYTTTIVGMSKGTLTDTETSIVYTNTREVTVDTGLKDNTTVLLKMILFALTEGLLILLISLNKKHKKIIG